MFYIEKNDKPNWLEKRLNIIKIRENTIFLPMEEEMKGHKIEKLAMKTKKIIQKYSNSKKIVLSKELQNEQLYINYLNSYGLEIQNGRWLFEILLPEVVEYIINKKKIEKINISIMINDLTDIEFENIKTLARKYKNINIVTNHMEKFKNLEKQLQEDEGIIITITNNRKKSLMKSKIILNIDFPQELINKYNVQDEAIIVNIKRKTKINKKRFNGLIINDYEIDFRDDKKNNKALNNKFYLKDLYESELYKKQRISEIKKKIKIDKVVIEKLNLNNGKL
jgi:hypothetical protein